MNTLKTNNPATGEQIGEYPQHTDEELTHLIDRAQEAFVSWRTRPLNERASKMTEVAEQLRKQSAELAALITREMGKPIQQSRAEIEKCAMVCEFYADQAESFLTPETIETNATESYVRFDPLGPLLAVMPWNYPFWQVFRFLAPSLMAGNTGLLKHATNVTGCAQAIERIIREAGFPPGVFTSLLIESGRVARVIEDTAVRAVTLTGSEPAGRAVGEVAGKQLKKCVLELGGSDPFIVLSDTDIKATANQAAKARTQNTGQSCIAAKRFLVEDSIADEFTATFVKEMEAVTFGDPIDETMQMGAMARSDLRDELHEQVRQSVSDGAKLLTGGKIPDGIGAFYPPTVLAEVKPGMAAFEEELFGPVAAVIRVADGDEAVAIANQSRFGLGASIWTGDASRAQELASQIESGCVFVNEIVKSDPRVPFGGVKDSGYGRELSHFGIREFVNIKTVWVG